MKVLWTDPFYIGGVVLQLGVRVNKAGAIRRKQVLIGSWPGPINEI